MVVSSKPLSSPAKGKRSERSPPARRNDLICRREHPPETKFVLQCSHNELPGLYRTLSRMATHPLSLNNLGSRRHQRSALRKTSHFEARVAEVDIGDTDMEDVAAVARRYSDIEVDVFFESEESEDERSLQEASLRATSKRLVSQMPREEEISRDLARIDEALLQQPFRASSTLGLQRMMRSTPTEEWQKLARASTEQVQRSLSDMSLPAVVSGLVDHWAARDKWKTGAQLLVHYASLPVAATRLVPVGEMGKSQKVQVFLASYLRYCETTTSDFPLYVFDYDLPSSELRFDYSPPPIECFKRDLFDPESYPADFPRDSLGYFNKTEWVILGSKGTGSPLHKDPLYTSAWNALLCGRKRWAVFPPHIELSRLRKRGDTESPALWFLEELPKLRSEPELGLIEFTQDAGDVVYLPEGWWHAVLNVSEEIAMAVTHNAVLPETVGLWPRLRQTHAEFVAAFEQYKHLF